MRSAVLLVLLALPALAGGDDSAPPAPGEPLVTNAPKFTNRLAKESSPYLLQHAHNPVDWWPWGDEAFEKARKEDKPVFLSIGYSTCHWCHVMERESFEDEAIARLLNERFVSIKVDREERPDVDAAYMAAVQATTGQGGWPLSVFLTHDRKPFYGGTYFPPEDRFGRPGFPTLLRRLDQIWKDQRADVEAGARELTEAMRRQSEGARASGELSAAPLAHAVEQFDGSFDEEHAGFGPAPKFPRAFALSFLLQQARGDAAVAAKVEATLDAMRRGGIHDQLGGGFHRYSTDAHWLVPHFEKMLYDQALLLHAYVDAWLVTRDARWERTARGIVEYVLRDLRDPAGGFLSAEDADSEGVEGKFYVWTEAEMAAVLTPKELESARSAFNVSAEGNFLDELRHVTTGANILHLSRGGAGVDEAIRAKLLAARSKRVRPHLDDKVLADWNGLMIGALARAGAAFGDDRYVAEAVRAAEFVLGSMRTADGSLLHRWRKGDAAIPAFLEDHAYLALGLHDLYEATFDPRWLAASRDLLRVMVRDFRDEDGAFTLSRRGGEALPARSRELYDGATPSGNSSAALALLRVGAATGDEALAAAGRECLEAWMPTIERFPMGYPYALTALAWALGPTREIVIAGDPADPATRALVAEVRRRYLPHAVVLLHPPGGPAAKALEAVAPFVAPQGPLPGADGKPRAAAYVCRDRTCAAPVTSAADLAKLLDAE